MSKPDMDFLIYLADVIVLLIFLLDLWMKIRIELEFLAIKTLRNNLFRRVFIICNVQSICIEIPVLMWVILSIIFFKVKTGFAHIF